VALSASIEWLDLIPNDEWSLSFDGGESKTFRRPLSIPAGYAGYTCHVVVNIFDPAGNLLDSATAAYAIGECVNGSMKCEGTGQYQCQLNRWVLIDPKSPSCGYKTTEVTLTADLVALGVIEPELQAAALINAGTRLADYPDEAAALQSTIEAIEAGESLSTYDIAVAVSPTTPTVIPLSPEEVALVVAANDPVMLYYLEGLGYIPPDPVYYEEPVYIPEPEPVYVPEPPPVQPVEEPVDIGGELEQYLYYFG